MVIVYEPRVCERCSAAFSPRGPVQKVCTPCNVAYKNRSEAQKWLDKKPPRKNIDCNHIPYTFWRKDKPCKV